MRTDHPALNAESAQFDVTNELITEVFKHLY